METGRILPRVSTVLLFAGTFGVRPRWFVEELRTDDGGGDRWEDWKCPPPPKLDEEPRTLTVEQITQAALASSQPHENTIILRERYLHGRTLAAIAADYLMTKQGMRHRIASVLKNLPLSFVDDKRPLFARRLEQLRRMRKWTFGELGSAARVSAEAVSRIERGKCDPTLASICDLADALDAPRWAFLEDE